MPIVDANDPNVWATQWTGGYRREKFHLARKPNARILINALNLRPGQKILLIGAGFGWTAEWLEEEGISVTATDTSTWIQTNKGEHAKHKILNIDVLTDPDKLKGKWTCVVSENVIPWYTITEAKALNKAMAKLGPVAHFVTPRIVRVDGKPLKPEPEPKWSWLFIEEWRDELPNAKIISACTGEII